MALDNGLKEQLKQYLELLENPVEFALSVDDSDQSNKVLSFINEIVAMSDKLTVNMVPLDRTPSFQVNRQGQQPSGVAFAGLPLGHEFTSFVLALLQVGGRQPKEEQTVIDQIKAINQDLHFETYISLTCHNCPDVVQALNIMSILNPRISHTMIEGGMYQSEVDSRGVMAVPTVFLNGEEFSGGRISLEQILEKISGPADISELNTKEPFDVLVIGGGPAGASAAIYAARKGIRTGIVADTFGGQVMETLGIENVIGTPYTEGPKLMAQIEAHMNEYDVDIMKNQRVASVEKKQLVEIALENGAVLKSKTAVIATGARWRNLGIPGEQAFKNKGVAYCPHCDGPIFAGKEVAVIGGGNSGIEAAIDLAGIVKHVTVLEFMPELKADNVLQERLLSLPNVTVITNVETKEIVGDSHVSGLHYVDRETGEAHDISIAGVFILIGLVPVTDWLNDTVERNNRGEIVVNERGATSLPGVFAAGDCTNSAYKQIIISMGSGATAALGAFDYMIRDLTE